MFWENQRGKHKKICHIMTISVFVDLLCNHFDRRFYGNVNF